MVIGSRLCKDNVPFDDSYHMVLAPCKLGQIRKMIVWQFAVIGSYRWIAIFLWKNGFLCGNI